MLDRILSLSKQLKLIGFVTLAILISSCAPQQRETSIGPSIDVKKPVQVALLLPKSHPKTQTLSTSLENATHMAVGDLKNVQIQNPSIHCFRRPSFGVWDKKPAGDAEKWPPGRVIPRPWNCFWPLIPAPGRVFGKPNSTKTVQKSTLR